MALGFNGGISYFILLQEHESTLVQRSTAYKAGKMKRGSIMKEDSAGLVPVNKTTEKERIIWSVENNLRYVKCKTTDLTPLTLNELELLLGIENPEERCRVFDDKELFDFGLRLDKCVGEHVQIDFHDGTVSSGYIRHVGPVTGRKGTWFGIELDQV